LLMRFCR